MRFRMSSSAPSPRGSSASDLGSGAALGTVCKTVPDWKSDPKQIPPVEQPELILKDSSSLTSGPETGGSAGGGTFSYNFGAGGSLDIIGEIPALGINRPTTLLRCCPQ